MELPSVALEITNNDWTNGVKTPSSCDQTDDTYPAFIIDGVRFVRTDVSYQYENADNRSVALSYCIVNDSGVKYQLIPRIPYSYDQQAPDTATSYSLFDKVIQALDFQFI